MAHRAQHPLYVTWQMMKRRCFKVGSDGYENYGGRGITVCPRWLDFRAFEADMGERPEGHTLDRIDNDGPYSPENCRWATRRGQSRNTRKTVYVTIEGVEYKATELSDLSSQPVATIKKRVAKGWSYERVMTPHKIVHPILAETQEKAWAKRRAVTHCKRGHEFTPANTYFDRRGSRCCRECVNAKGRAWRAKRDGRSIS